MCQLTDLILSFFLSMIGDPDVCTNRVENAVYVAAGNDPYELLEVRLKEWLDMFHVDKWALKRISDIDITAAE